MGRMMVLGDILSPWLYPLLFGTGFAAGFVDSIAGGGGLITVPVLLSLGYGPQAALATNKLQASFGSGSAAWHYARAGLIDGRECSQGVAITFLAAAAGTLTVQHVSPNFLRRAIPVLLIGIAIYLLLRPKTGLAPRPPRLKPAVFAATFGILLGFYDGFFGPGTGTFWAMACVLWMGFDLTKATAYTKAMNFASNLGSLLVFLLGGQVHFAAGVVMGLGQWSGARVGSQMVVRQGTGFIRPVFLAVVLSLTVKLLWDAFF